MILSGRHFSPLNDVMGGGAIANDDAPAGE